ncbi:MAG TPA: OmpH family outer membrane protein [Paracoccaceae bacterium]|nr:OmpH family outer membrane protein [Paracoccaceae bacterium]
MALAAAAQGDRLPVVIVYQDLLLERSEAGRRLKAEEDAATDRLVEERRRIEAEFEAEEKRLAAMRPTLAREEFARLAEEFDAKVREARAAQDERAVAAQRTIEQNRQRFLESLRPVLAEVMSRYGASVLLDGRSVLLADPSLDITGEVIARMDELMRERPP